MKRILINATHNEEVRVALCKGNHLYDFDLENRTREQKKANIYKGHVTRVEPSLEAVFVEYGSKRQGFLPVREIASEYLSGNPREENIRKLIKEGDELIVQVEKEERGNKGAALSTYVSLAGRYLVLMPNNPKGGGISRQISGKLREDMKRMLGNLDLPKGMSVIVRTAGIGKTQEDLQHDLNHLLNIWNAIQDQNKKYASPRLVHQEAGVVTRAVRDYLRDDIAEIWIDNEEAFIEAETFVKAVMPKQVDKLRKYTDFEPMFSSFNVERQIETAYQREVRLPSGGSIVIDQTEALVSIDINSAKSTKGADVAETAYHTNLEAADEIARQLRLRDMGGLVVIDFIDMNDSKHQKEVEKRLVEATKYDRARVQFGEISRFGLMEMSRQRLRPSLEESTGYICPRCHGNGMIRDLRSLSLSIMRQIEQTALKERHGEVQAEVPTDIAAFLLNEKRESLVYLEQDSGTRITILPHAHLESPNFNIHFNHHGFAPASYKRVTDTQQQETSGLGYDVDWQTAESERPEQQPTRQPRQSKSVPANKALANTNTKPAAQAPNAPQAQRSVQQPAAQQKQAEIEQAKPAAVAWLSNLFAPTPQAQMSATVSSADAAQAIEAIVNTGAESRGAFGQVSANALASTSAPVETAAPKNNADSNTDDSNSDSEKERRRSRNSRNRNNKNDKRSDRNKPDNRRRNNQNQDDKKSADSEQKTDNRSDNHNNTQDNSAQKEVPKREPHSKRESRGAIERGDTKQPQKSDRRSQDNRSDRNSRQDNKSGSNRSSQRSQNERPVDPNEVNLRVTEAQNTLKEVEVVHISLDDSKPSNKERSKAPAKSDNKPENKSEAAKNQPSEKPVKADKPEQSTKPAVKPIEQKAAVEEKPQQPAPEAKKKASATEAKSTQQKESAPVKATEAKAEQQPKAEALKEAVEASESKAPEKEAAPKAVAKAEDNKENDSSNVTLAFDVDALFADRYVAAKKFGQAANDPRVIKASLQKSSQAAPVVAAATPAAVISGSVGQFIHTHLAQPRMRLAKDGVIACFLAALNAHKETSGSSAKPAVKNKPVVANESAQAFSFVNYGYQSLSPNYLEQFAQMTSAVAAHSVEQGKTDAKPSAVGARAANDPRGQHPDYTPTVKEAPTSKVESTDLAQATEAAQTEPTAAETMTSEPSNTAADEKSPAQAMGELLALNVGDFVSKVLGAEGTELLNAGQTEAAFLKALRQPWDVLMSVAKTVTTTVATAAEAPTEVKTADTDVVESTEHAADAQTTDAQADAASEESAESSLASNDAEVQLAAANSSNKTSIETYKSMIENISEQLLPQTGLLNLTSPKVPKARTRKAKDEPKKAEAEKDSDS